MHGASCGVQDLNPPLSVETQNDLLFRSEKTQLRASTVERVYSSFQNPQILGTIFSGRDVNHTLNSL